MHKSTLIEILRTFNREDLARFEDFVNSPFHNKNSNVVKLFVAMKKFAPDFTDEKLDKEKVWLKLFPSKPYNYGVVKNLIHDLTKLSESYTAYNYYVKNMKKEESLIGGFYERGAFEILEKKVKKYYKNLETIKHRSTGYFEKEIFILPHMNRLRNETELVDNLRVTTNSALLKYFLIFYLTNSFHLVVEEQRANVKHDHSFLRHLLDFFKQRPEMLAGSPELHIYYHMMLSYLDIFDDRNFQIAYHDFNKNYDTLGDTDRKNVYNILITLCLLKSDAGKREYRKEQLLIQIEMVNNGCLAHMKGLPVPASTYRSIVASASELEEFDILEEFISKYRNSVKKKVSGVLNIYSDAMLFFSRSEFERCAELCSRINFGDMFSTVNIAYYLKNDVKLLIAKCFYEMGATESLLAALDAHRHFLRNAEYINEHRKLPVANFINFISELIKLKLKNDNVGLHMLKQEIENTERLNSQNWFLRKINELSV